MNELKLEKHLKKIMSEKGIYRDSLIFTVHEAEEGWQLKVGNEYGGFTIKLKSGAIKTYKTLNTIGRKMKTFGIKEFDIKLL